MSETKMLKALVKVKCIHYPREKFEEGKWTIFSCEIVSVEEGEPYNDIEIVVKGSPYSLDVGSLYNLIGVYDNHPKYGKAYTICQFTKAYNLNSPELQRTFLKTITSESNVEKLFQTFQNPIQILDRKDTISLSSIKGIGKKTAINLINKYDEVKTMAKAYAVLGMYDISTAVISSLLKKYDNNADKLVWAFENNPYILMYELNGIGWARADKIANAKGIVGNDPTRVQAAIYYKLNEAAQAGHTWLSPSALVQETLSFLGAEADVINVFRDSLHTLHDNNIICWDKDKTMICMKRLCSLEEKIANELHRLITSKSFGSTYTDYKLEISKLEQEQGWEYTEQQKNAIEATLNSSVSIITGSAGVGKSTVVKGILRLLRGRSFAQCALSGRAAARLTETTGKEGMTIHRLLKYNGLECVYDKTNPLDYDIIILDEVSMVGAQLFYKLIQAINDGAKLIMLGDFGQLESIGLCNIFKDMIESGVIPVSNLTVIHRQAAKSAIVTESQKVRNGFNLVPNKWVGRETRGQLKDLQLIVYGDNILSQDYLIEEFDKLVASGVSPKDIQVLVAMKERGSISTKAINIILQQKINPDDPWITKRISKTDYEIREGDKVLITRNMYDASRNPYDIVREDDASNKYTEICPVFNGDIGYVKYIANDSVVINFPQYGMVRISSDNWDGVELGYAMTCHKLQGSQAPYVLIGLDTSAYSLLTKEWLYTAITRAKKHCIICAETKSLSIACNTSNVMTKQTLLSRFLRRSFGLESVSFE